MKVYIYVPGDPLVGIFPLIATVDLGYDPEKEDRDWVRHKLQVCFNEIYNQPVGVEFNDEREKWLQKLKEEEEKRTVEFIEDEIMKQEEGM